VPGGARSIGGAKFPWLQAERGQCQERSLGELAQTPWHRLKAEQAQDGRISTLPGGESTSPGPTASGNLGPIRQSL